MSEVKKTEEVPTILVVEDDFDIGIIYRHFFRSKGIEVVLARNGKEGLQKLAGMKADLILTDIDMPLMNGNEFCQHVLRDRLTEAPIVAVTGHPSNATAPFTRVIQKPFQIMELTRTVEEMLKR